MSAARARLEPRDTPTLRPNRCDWCGCPINLGRKYCTPAHRRDYNNLMARQGKAIMQDAKLWRKYRGGKNTPGAASYSELVTRIDAANAEDRARWQEFAGQKKA